MTVIIVFLSMKLHTDLSITNTPLSPPHPCQTESEHTEHFNIQPFVHRLPSSTSVILQSFYMKFNQYIHCGLIKRFYLIKDWCMQQKINVKLSKWHFMTITVFSNLLQLVGKMSSVNKTVLIYLMGYKFSNSQIAVYPITDETSLRRLWGQKCTKLNSKYKKMSAAFQR